MKWMVVVSGMLLAAITALVLQPDRAAAFNPQYIWSGRGVITKLTSQCSTTPLRVGQEFNSNYRPRVDKKKSEPPAGLTLVFGQSAIVIKQNSDKPGSGQMSGNNTYVAFMVRSGVDISPKLEGTYSNTIKNFFNGQKGFDETTISLTIDPGNINNFGGTVGCTVTFRAAYSRNDP